MKYDVYYSNRRTVGIYVKNGAVEVRAPYGYPAVKIRAIVNEHAEQIKDRLQRSMAAPSMNILPEQVKPLKEAAMQYFTKRTAEYARIMGLSSYTVNINGTRRRMGSCDSNRRICYSYRLMLYPESVRDYVVVHELSHLIEMNHSKRFWDIVEKYMPDYKERKRLLVN